LVANSDLSVYCECTETTCQDDLTIKPTPSLQTRLLDPAKTESKAGNGCVHVYLGRVYATGNGSCKDDELAREHLGKAEKKGRALATS